MLPWISKFKVAESKAAYKEGDIGYRREDGALFFRCPFHSETGSPHLRYRSIGHQYTCYKCGARGGWKKLSAALVARHGDPEDV